MEKFIVKFEGSTTKYNQIAKHIKFLIEKKLIEDGEKLPSIRSLATYLCVNNSTIISAYKKLQEEGYVIIKDGSGTFAKTKRYSINFKKKYVEITRQLSQNKECCDFTGENIDIDFFSINTFKKVLNEVIDFYGVESLTYQDRIGFEDLRNSIKDYFWDGSIKSEDILILSGAQQGIDIASKVLLNVNDSVVVEKPTYAGALSVFMAKKVNIIDVPIEEDGIDLIELEKILKRNKIKLLYLMSYFQNPTGMSYSNYKKEYLLYLAKKYDFYIIEDDYLSEFIYDSSIKYNSFKSLDKNNRVIYIKSFSKIFLPGIRLGYLVAPPLFKDQFQNSKINTDISTSSLMQRVLYLYINKGYWDDHIINLNKYYKKKYEYFKNRVDDKLKDLVSYKDPRGGLSFYFKLNQNINIDSVKLFYLLIKYNIYISPGTLFFKDADEGKRYFKLGFSKTDYSKIDYGLEKIQKILIENQRDR